MNGVNARMWEVKRPAGLLRPAGRACSARDQKGYSVCQVKTVDESHSARVLIGCKPIRPSSAMCIALQIASVLNNHFAATVDFQNFSKRPPDS